MIGIAEQRAKIERALAARVRPLTPRQVQTCKRRQAERERRRSETVLEVLEMWQRLRRGESL